MKTNGKKITVWDVPVRLFHWALALLVCLSWYSAEQDKFGIWADIHLWCGFGVITLIVWRLLWGIIGSDTARFREFVKGPQALMAYLRGNPVRHPGHNPLGAFSVLLLLALPLGTAILGLFSSDGMFFSGPFAGENGGEIKGIHRQLGELLYWLAALHIGAVLWYWIVKKINLVLPMISGKKMLAEGQKQPKMKPVWLAVAIFIPVALLAYAVVLGF